MFNFTSSCSDGPKTKHSTDNQPIQQNLIYSEHDPSSVPQLVLAQPSSHKSHILPFVLGNVGSRGTAGRGREGVCSLQCCSEPLQPAAINIAARTQRPAQQLLLISGQNKPANQNSSSINK